MEPQWRIPLRLVFYKDAKGWVAHCLEFDLIGDGSTKQEALERLSAAISIQIGASIEHKNPANLFRPADGKYFGMFFAGKDIARGQLSIERIGRDNVVIEETECREYVDGDLIPA